MNFKSNKRKCTTLNYRKYFSLVLVLCLWGISPQLIAQGGTKIVKGIVVDELNEPMIGVNVMEKGTSNGTITDFNGKFQLKVSPSGSSLVVTYIGYAKKEVSVGNADVKIQLAPDTKQIEEIVVVGYAQQTKKSVVGAIAQTSGESLKSKGAVSDITEALNGSIPGVTVMSKSSAPGGGGIHGENPEILIRGLGTWNNSQPLILVDGVERSMSDINIDEIENFSVLKDASATAVFGVKGANGVILITSKRGQLGKAKVSAEVNMTMKSVSHIDKPLSSYDGFLARNYAMLNEFPLMTDEKQMSFFTPTRVLEYYRDGVDPQRYPNIDWQDEMLRSQAISSKYSVNVSGGTEFVKYFTSLAYLNDGDIMNTGGENPRGYKNEFKYDRLNFRTNLDFSITKSTTFKVNLSGYYGRQQAPNQFANTFWNGVYKYSPASPPPVYEDGVYGHDDVLNFNGIGVNYLYKLQTGGTKVNKRTALTSDFELEQKLDFVTKGLSVKGRFSFDNYFSSEGSNLEDKSDYVRKRYNYATNKFDYEIPGTGGDGFDFQPQPLGYSKESNKTDKTQRNLYYEMAVNYRRSFGKHNVGGLALFSRQENATGSAWARKREDWVGRVTYDYDGKYLFETNGAYNGSEQFLEKFDFFPSFALGWRVSEEPFMKNVPQISNLKLRYSIGWVGSDNIPNSQWSYITSWDNYSKTFVKATQSQGPAFGTAIGGVNSIYVTNSFVEGTAGNPLLHWETARKQNYGIDFGFFDELISGTFDYFRDHRYDMLIPSSNRLSVPDFYGHKAPSVNAGEVNLKGFEIDIKVRKKLGQVNVWGGYTWTVAQSEIVYVEDSELLPSHQKRAGYRIGQSKTLISTDVIDSWDKLYTGVMGETATGRRDALPGSIRMLDFNGDGIITATDETAAGYSRQPENTYGFSFGADYKGFSLMAQFYGMYNTTVDGSWYNEELMYDFPIVYPSQVSRTATPEYGIENPTYRAIGLKKQGGMGSFAKFDASVFRLKTMELSYTFPKKLLKKMTIENLRFFVNGNNLLFWSDLPVDIEGKNFSGNPVYPNTRNINFGMNVTL